jgi:hypothetical protein
MSSSATDGAEGAAEVHAGEDPAAQDTDETVDNERDDGDSGDTALGGDALGGDGGYADEESSGRPKVSKLAVVALITGVLALIPVALITGVAALVSIRRSGRGGHGMAVTALFFAVGWLVIGGALGAVAQLTHGFQKPVKVVYHQSAVFSLRTGECVDTPDSTTVTQLPCAGPHDAEVFGTFTLPGQTWPGTTSVQQQAAAGCGDRLTSYQNPQLAISLAQTYVYPNQVDWNAGTRTVICEVRAASGQLTESVRGGASSGS